MSACLMSARWRPPKSTFFAQTKTLRYRSVLVSPGHRWPSRDGAWKLFGNLT